MRYRRFFALISVLAVGSLLLSGCELSNSHVEDGSAVPQTQSTTAPYPANVKHLDDILALAEMKLPENVDEVSVEPAYVFERDYPQGWGYVVYFKTDESTVRAFLSDNAQVVLSRIEHYKSCAPMHTDEDLPVAEASRPICTVGSTGTGNAEVLIERPLGRVWILIRGE